MVTGQAATSSILIDATDKMEHLLDASESVDGHEFLNSRVGGGFICISDIKPQGHIIQPALASCVLYFLQCLPHTRTLIEFYKDFWQPLKVHPKTIF